MSRFDAKQADIKSRAPFSRHFRNAASQEPQFRNGCRCFWAGITQETPTFHLHVTLPCQSSEGFSMTSNIVAYERGLSYLKMYSFLLLSSTCLHVALFKCYHCETIVYFKKYDQELLPVSWTIASDIVSIKHIPSLEMIKVTPNENQTCLKPVLRWRLAGPTTAIIEWDKVDRGKHELYRYYKVPYTKIYFFKIIALLCNELHFHQDFSSTCLEDNMKHRIAVDNSVIVLEKIDESYENI